MICTFKRSLRHPGKGLEKMRREAAQAGRQEAKRGKQVEGQRQGLWWQTAPGQVRKDGGYRPDSTLHKVVRPHTTQAPALKEGGLG